MTATTASEASAPVLNSAFLSTVSKVAEKEITSLPAKQNLSIIEAEDQDYIQVTTTLNLPDNRVKYSPLTQPGCLQTAICKYHSHRSIRRDNCPKMGRRSGYELPPWTAGGL